MGEWKRRWKLLLIRFQDLGSMVGRLGLTVFFFGGRGGEALSLLRFMVLSPKP